MGQRLTDELAPTGDRTAIIAPASMVEFLDATKGLFAAQSNLNEQFREGMMGRTGGLDVGENTLLPPHTTGTMAGSPLTFGTTLGLSTTANSWVSTTALSVTGATAAGTAQGGRHHHALGRVRGTSGVEGELGPTAAVRRSGGRDDDDGNQHVHRDGQAGAASTALATRSRTARSPVCRTPAR
jgi:hypothetical protein